MSILSVSIYARACFYVHVHFYVWPLQFILMDNFQLLLSALSTDNFQRFFSRQWSSTDHFSALIDNIKETCAALYIYWVMFKYVVECYLQYYSRGSYISP